MLTGNMHAQRLMPNYIRNLRRKPVVEQQPLPEVGAEPVAAMMPPRQTNAAPMGLMQQAAPKHNGQKPGFDMGLFNQSFEKPKMTMSDKLGLVSGYLMDLDGSFGSGNADKFKGMYDERVDEQRGMFDEKRNQALMMAAAQGDRNALFMLDPSLAFGREDRASDVQYRDRTYGDSRLDRADDVGHRNRVQTFSEMDANRGFGLQEELGRGNLAINEEELGIRRTAAEADAAARQSGANRPTKEDQNGVLRYLDGDKEPVFPDVKVAAAPPKPLIGSESMGRVAAGLGNMRQAVSDLTTLVMPKDEGGQGYAPGYDWGAKWLDASLPFVGDPLARWAGGKDYQQFENAYAAFEAAALPIMSGAAVTDSEAKRALKALRVKIGDSDEAVAAKMQNMQRMVQGLEMAAQGDTSFLQTAVKDVDAGGATAPAAAPNSAPVQIRDDNDFDALPSGAIYVGPDGVRRVKP